MGWEWSYLSHRKLKLFLLLVRMCAPDRGIGHCQVLQAHPKPTESLRVGPGICIFTEAPGDVVPFVNH